VEALTLYQIGALAAFARAHGTELTHVKPHGALYNDAVKDRPQAQALARAVSRFSSRLILVGLAGSIMIEAADELNQPYAREAFADRAYEADGTLRSRSKPGALLTNPVEVGAQALRIARDHSVTAYTSETVAIEADTLCLHGDNPAAVQNAAAVRQALEAAGVRLSGLRVEVRK
jgi:UPF0271 protein